MKKWEKNNNSSLILHQKLQSNRKLKECITVSDDESISLSNQFEPLMMIDPQEEDNRSCLTPTSGTQTPF